MLSRELRTPLNTVLGYTRMLRRDDERMTGELRERALSDALERNADSLSRLVGDLLGTSRIVTGKLQLVLNRCPVDGGRAAGRRHHPARRRRQRRGDRDHEPSRGCSRWPIAIGCSRCCGTCSRTRSSSRRPGGECSRAPSGAARRWRSRCRTPASASRPTRLPYVLQRFWQAHTGASREFAGLGIGLALARHLVELHGGTIAAESAGLGRDGSSR